MVFIIADNVSEKWPKVLDLKNTVSDLFNLKKI
jgi:hypothetical protein